MATHSSTLAWKIPWTEERGRLQSMGSLGVRHDWMTSLSLFTFHFPALEKEMETHSSVLAWRIPGTGEPDGLPSLGSHDWSDLAAAAAKFNYFVYLLAAPPGLEDLSSPTRDQTQVQEWKYWALTTGLPGESSNDCIYYSQYSFSSTACCLGHKGCVCVCVCVCVSCIPGQILNSLEGKDWSQTSFMSLRGLE